MKKILIIAVLLTAAISSHAQWSQKIIDKYTETGRAISTSMINYEDSIGSLYFDEGFNDVFYVKSNLPNKRFANSNTKNKKVTAKIELYNEFGEIVETINNYQFIPQDLEDGTVLTADKVDAKGVAQRRTNKKILDFLVNEKGYARFVIPSTDGENFIFKILCKQIC